MDLKELRRKMMQDPEVAAAYQKLRPKLELGRRILDLRLERGWTQKELAKRAGTKQANISRLENALLNPSMDMLQKIAGAFGESLDIHIGPTEEEVNPVQEAVTGTTDREVIAASTVNPMRLPLVCKAEKHMVTVGSKSRVEFRLVITDEVVDACSPETVPSPGASPLTNPVGWFDHSSEAVESKRFVA